MSKIAIKEVAVVVFRDPGCPEEGLAFSNEVAFVGETISEAREFVLQQECWAKRSMHIETRAALVTSKIVVLLDAIEMGAQPTWKTRI